MSEIVTVSVGQCGIQLGQAVWEQYCAEHNIDKNGTKSNKQEDQSFKCFFEETNNGKYFPRSLMVDSEPNVIDDVKASAYAAIFNPSFLLTGYEDAANNFARGHYTIGKEMIDKINDRLRKLVENCNNLNGFFINHAVGGGTGSGLGVLILERIAVDYRKRAKIGIEIFPSPIASTSVLEAYNSLLTTHWLLDHTDISLLMDNESIYEIIQKNLDVGRPSYENVNRLITKPISSLTASLRFNGELNGSLNEIVTNLVPFPRLHFMITSMAPITTPKKYEKTPVDVQAITDFVVQGQNFFLKIADFDPEYDKYLAMSVNYRGDAQIQDVNAAIQGLKINKKIAFVEWCPTGFKVGLNEQPPAVLECDDISPSTTNCVMIGNNTAISRVFTERICKKYDLMYSQRAFVHVYVREKMEEGEFAEARENIGFLEKDYLDVLSEQNSDEDEESD